MSAATTTSTLSPAADTDARCPVCPHAVADHDAIAQRYCRATANSALERGCVCE
jgi:hypothetical protein